jgi:hypothetical protein
LTLFFVYFSCISINGIVIQRGGKGDNVSNPASSPSTVTSYMPAETPIDGNVNVQNGITQISQVITDLSTSIITNLIASAVLFLVAYITLKGIEERRSEWNSTEFADKVTNDVAIRIAEDKDLQKNLSKLQIQEANRIRSIIKSFSAIARQDNLHFKQVSNVMLAEYEKKLRGMSENKLDDWEAGLSSFLQLNIDLQASVKSIFSVTTWNEEYWLSAFGKKHSHKIRTMKEMGNASLDVTRVWIYDNAFSEKCCDVAQKDADSGIRVWKLNDRQIEDIETRGFIAWDFMIIEFSTGLSCVIRFSRNDIDPATNQRMVQAIYVPEEVKKHNDVCNRILQHKAIEEV